MHPQNFSISVYKHIHEPLANFVDIFQGRVYITPSDCD